MKSALITGIRGFVGSHLSSLMLDDGWKVIGLDRKGEGPERMNQVFSSQHNGAPGKIENISYIASDLSNHDQLLSIFKDHSFDAIVHLAGMAFVPEGWKNPASMLQSNAICTINLLSAGREAGWKGRFVYVSSSDVYGNTDASDLPIHENSPVRPNSPYASSKLAAEQFCGYFLRDGIQVVIARPFNHIGPGQKTHFVVPSFLQRIRQAAKTNENKITVGDMESGRDFTDVRDVARAYMLLIEKGIVGDVYNICTGKMVTIKEIMDISLKIAGTDLKYQVDPALLRPEGATYRYGSSEKLKAAGWKPGYTLEQSIRDMWKFMDQYPEGGIL